jgi:hypothetical protein
MLPHRQGPKQRRLTQISDQFVRKDTVHPWTADGNRGCSRSGRPLSPARTVGLTITNSKGKSTRVFSRIIPPVLAFAARGSGAPSAPPAPNIGVQERRLTASSAACYQPSASDHRSQKAAEARHLEGIPAWGRCLTRLAARAKMCAPTCDDYPLYWTAAFDAGHTFTSVDGKSLLK